MMYIRFAVTIGLPILGAVAVLFLIVGRLRKNQWKMSYSAVADAYDILLELSGTAPAEVRRKHTEHFHLMMSTHLESWPDDTFGRMSIFKAVHRQRRPD